MFKPNQDMSVCGVPVKNKIVDREDSDFVCRYHFDDISISPLF